MDIKDISVPCLNNAMCIWYTHILQDFSIINYVLLHVYQNTISRPWISFNYVLFYVLLFIQLYIYTSIPSFFVIPFVTMPTIAFFAFLPFLTFYYFLLIYKKYFTFLCISINYLYLIYASERSLLERKSVTSVTNHVTLLFITHVYSCLTCVLSFVDLLSCPIFFS